MKFPVPCEENFYAVGEEDLLLLEEWMWELSKESSPVKMQLTFAAEVFGELAAESSTFNAETAAVSLLNLLMENTNHTSIIEGILYGLALVADVLPDFDLETALEKIPKDPNSKLARTINSTLDF